MDKKNKDYINNINQGNGANIKYKLLFTIIVILTVIIGIVSIFNETVWYLILEIITDLSLKFIDFTKSIYQQCYNIFCIEYNSILPIMLSNLTFIGVKLGNLVPIMVIFLLDIKHLMIIVLSIIFFKALLLNFRAKHLKKIGIGLNTLKYFNIKNSTKVIEYININKLKILIFIFKSLFISILIRIMVRNSTILLFEFRNDNINNILAILLSITIFYYLLNLAIKRIKKEKLTGNDYYLYNNYVVEKINIFNLSYIILINQIIVNYHKEFIIIILTLGFTVIIYLIFKYISYLDTCFFAGKQEKKIRLNSTFGKDLELFVFIGTMLKGVIEDQYKNFIPDSPIIPIDKMGALPHLGTDGSISCHWPNAAEADIEKDTLGQDEILLLDQIERTPLVKIAKAQINTLREKYNPRLPIDNKGYYIKGDLMISFVRSDYTMFVNMLFKGHTDYAPNFYVDSNNIQKSVGVLGKNLNANLEYLFAGIKSMIIFTPMKYDNFLDAYKVFRPDMYYTDINTVNLSLKDYFEFHYVNNSKNTSDILIWSEVVKYLSIKNSMEGYKDIEQKVHSQYMEDVMRTYNANMGIGFISPCLKILPNNIKGCFLDIYRNLGLKDEYRGMTPFELNVLLQRNKNLREIDFYSLVKKGVVYISDEKVTEKFDVVHRLTKERYSNFYLMSSTDLQLSFSESRMNLLNRVLENLNTSEIPSSKCSGVVIQRLNHEYFFFDSNTTYFSSTQNQCKVFSIIDNQGSQHKRTPYAVLGRDYRYGTDYFSFLNTSSYKFGFNSIERVKNTIYN